MGFCHQRLSLKRENEFKKLQNKIVLSEEEEQEVIQNYSNIEKSIKVKDDCAIGVGYNTCMDINFKAVDMIKAMEPELRDVLKQGEITPQVHEKISELREFIETFLYYFSLGANAERVSDSKELFYTFMDKINSEMIEHKDELGGHSAVFALRSQKEKCKVFIAAQAGDFNKRTLPHNDEQAKKHLIWPIDKLLDDQAIKKKKQYDTHLVFEYNEGDTIFGYTARRSNRFYFVHDPNGAYFKQMEPYHDLIKQYPHIQRHMFGGYQLMQKLNINEAEQRLQKLEELWVSMKSQPTPADHRIHVEFAHFSRLDFFRLFEHYAVRHADSLGMNEQELIMLLDFWEGKLYDINEARESKPTLEETLEQLKKFFKIVKDRKLDISRVHVHPYGSFIMCYDHNKWEDAKEALIKSALATPKYCKMTEALSDHIDNYDIPERPEYFANPQGYGEVIKVGRYNLTYEFNLNDDIKCYLQFFIKCRSMVKTAGMGDTISSMGFMYHVPKSQVKNCYEPRRTFTSITNDCMSKTQFRGGANHTVHYQTNGTGRDSYIVRDNGGFCKMYEPIRYPDLGTLGAKRRIHENAPSISAKNVYYHSDGTGRDSYIVSTSGGFNNVSKTTESRTIFVNSLRQYERPMSSYSKLGGMQHGMRRTASTNTFKHGLEAQQEIKKRDFLMESQLTFNWKYHQEQQQVRKSQRFMDERLAQPKRLRTKMPLNMSNGISRTIEI